MHCTVLFASPRGSESKTAALLQLFLEQWQALGHSARVFSLYDMDIAPCRACRACQGEHSAPACAIADGMDGIFASVLESDLILLATPIYSWYCTAPMKAALDRMVYALCKFYGPQKGPSLLAGRALACLGTCGYRPERAADLFTEGVARYCKHAQLRYLGGLWERHASYALPFAPDGAAVRAFARDVAERI